MTTSYRHVYLTAAGSCLPGDPIENGAIDRYVRPTGAASRRIQRRILAQNGIETRHYAIDEQGNTTRSVAGLGADAARDCLARAGVGLDAVTLLCTGTSGADLAVPGFASMVHGELGAPPLETSSHQGVCAAGMAALQHAAAGIELDTHSHALVVASEAPSRLFKSSRFEPHGYTCDFDSQFLRWMLSDGAGACLLSRTPRREGLSLRLDWLHLRSFAGDYPVCMQVGLPAGTHERAYLDYPSLAEAEAQGAFLLRQDIRLLPQLFEVGMHEYAMLVEQGHIDPRATHHFLCHYSSAKFAPLIARLMQESGLVIPTERWYSNLAWRGNTGAASIFIMLVDFLRDRSLQPGERVLAFVPESGRFTISFASFTVVAAQSVEPVPEDVMPPHRPEAAAGDAGLAALLRNLAAVWHDYRSRAWRTPLVRRIRDGQLAPSEYVRFMSGWIPQVREGSRWMRKAAANLTGAYAPLRELIEAHARDEQSDFRILFDDYRRAGGSEPSIDALRRNPGGEALNAYMHALAERCDPVGLLGAIYIIEGTGQRIIPALLPLLKRQLGLPPEVFRFLDYHGHNDEHHLGRWLDAVRMTLALDADGTARHAIEATARATAGLYLLQLEHAL